MNENPISNEVLKELIENSDKLLRIANHFMNSKKFYTLKQLSILNHPSSCNMHLCPVVLISGYTDTTINR